MITTSLVLPILGDFSARSGKSCYGLFNRHGGVSCDPYASLNVGHRLGDISAAVDENRRLVKEALGISRLLSAKQVHGRGIFCLKEPMQEDRAVEGVDALITGLSDVGLMIQQADCQAVLFFDPIRLVIAAAHCGWRGSVQGILPEVIEAMNQNYGSDPGDLLGVISPSLGPCCAEFVNYKSELPPEFEPFMVRDNYFDFWQISRHQLISAGMKETHIRIAGICTCCSDDYFSYRRTTRQMKGVTGRNCSVIAIRED